MTESHDMLCLFHAQLDEHDDDAFRIDIPEREVTVGELEPGETYRIGVYRVERTSTRSPSRSRREAQEPPVEVGETVEVEIEDVGDQGDGLARIGPGFIVFVPETEIADRVTVEITEVKQNFAFADVVDGPY